MVTRILIILLALTLSASAQRICPPNQVNRNGLVGRWLVPGKQTGDGALPALVLDDSGKGNHGTTSNAPNYGFIFYRPAMTFNGSNQYVSAGASAFNFTGLQPFSMSAWVYQTNNGGAKSIVGKYSTVSGTGQYNFYLRTGGYPTALLIRSQYNTARLNVQSSVAIPLNTWTHVSMTYSGGTSSASIKMFINGVETTYNASEDFGTFSPGMVLTTETFRTAASHDNANYFNGSINDVRIYNRLLSASEIRAIYQGEQ